MNAMQRITLTFALGVALAQPVMAQDTATDEHSAHHPDPAAAAANTTQPTETPTVAGMLSLRERMQEMRRTRDPAQRLQMMEEQMKQMDTVMKDMDTACPKTAGQKPGGMGMMGGKGGMGMMGGGMGKKGHGMGMHGGMEMSGGDDMMARRMEKLEKRVDMMLMMLMMR